MTSNKVFMAFGAGRESTDGGSFAKYVGVGQFKVLAVNPTKEELGKIYGTSIDNDIEYTSKDATDGTDQVRIDFIIESVAEKNNGVELKTKASYFLKNAPRFNAAKTKVQVINAYGESTWLDLGVAQAGGIPENQSWFEGPYRPALVGEEELTAFLKNYLNIPVKSWKDKNGNVKFIEDKTLAEARLEKISSYFKGNVKELQDIVKFQPNNTIQLPLGVKLTEDNKEYQTVFTRMTLKSNVKDYTKLEAAIKDAQDNGAYTGVTFKVGPLQVYGVEATSFTETATDASPAASAANFAAFFQPKEA